MVELYSIELEGPDKEGYYTLSCELVNKVYLAGSDLYEKYKIEYVDYKTKDQFIASYIHNRFKGLSPYLYRDKDEFEDEVKIYEKKGHIKKEEMMQKKKFTECRRKAKETGKELYAFRSVSMDGNFKGKLMLNYYKFYPNGKVEKIRINGLSNPFDPETNSEFQLDIDRTKVYMQTKVYLNDLSIPFSSEYTSIETRIPADPEVIEVTMADLEKKYGKKVKIVKEKN